MKKTTHTKVKANFRYPRIKKSDREFGASILLGEIIRENGDWRDFVPPFEIQMVNGVESSSCYVAGGQHAIAVIQEEQFNLPDQNYSARFNALLSNGTLNGGDPILASKSLKYDGLVLEEDMPFKDISNWEEYHSWKGVDMVKVRAKAKEFLEKWSLNFKILAEKDTPLKTKYLDLKEALKRSPIPVSVCAWYEANGEYYKPEGKRDNHFVLALYVDEKDRIHILDTYAPFIKVLSPKTNYEFALYWEVSKKPYEQKVNILKQIIALLGKWIGLVEEKPIIVPKPPVPAPQPQPAPIKTKREIILEEANLFLGKDITPKDEIPDEVACAQCLSVFLQKFDHNFPILPYTKDLLDEFKKNPKFRSINLPKGGSIIINATTTGNGKTRGHCGIILDNGRVASNNSVSGLWSDHWNLEDWDAHYRRFGGMPTHIFEYNDENL